MQTEIQKNHFKDENPLKTVQRIQKIFTNLGIEICEEWFNTESYGTPSVRVTFKGTKTGQNGKGVDENYARASAYAELIERYSNGIVDIKSLKRRSEYDFSIEHDEKFLSAEEIIEQKDPFISEFFKIRNMNSLNLENKINFFKEINTLDYLHTGKENTYLCIPYYDIQLKKIFYLPYNLLFFTYGSNGMSAGNSDSEAIVQGLAEIYERYVQKKILLEKPSLPTIPDWYIKKFPQVYQMYQDLKSLSNYNVILKDCSFGGRYPVAALIMIEKNTGMYGVKLGCHPDFGIAMERAFTEAAQGRNILEYTRMSNLDFTNKDVNASFNIENSFSVGKAQYPFEIFSDDSSENFTPVDDVSNYSNDEIMKKWIAKIQAENYNILIRNASHFGFPSFHIIIPGISETVFLDDSRIRAINTKEYAIKILHNPSIIEDSELKYIRASLGYFSKFIIINEIRNTFPNLKKIPYEKYNVASSIYLSALCSLKEGNLDQAIHYMSQAKEIIQGLENNLNHEDRARISAEYNYITALRNFKSHNKAMEYIRLFYDDKIYSFIDNIYATPKDVILKQYTNNIPDILDEEHQILFNIMSLRKKAQIDKKIDQMNLREVFS